MQIDWNAEVVDQLESHWRNRLRPRLDGLTDEELVWEPGPHGSEPVTTIAWRLTHLIEGFGTAPHFEVPAAAPPAVDFAGSAQAALRQFDEGYEAWIADVRSLGVAGMTRPQGALAPAQFAAAPIARLVMYVHVEVIHHGAEICLLRDVYAARAACAGC